VQSRAILTQRNCTEKKQVGVSQITDIEDVGKLRKGHLPEQGAIAARKGKPKKRGEREAGLGRPKSMEKEHMMGAEYAGEVGEREERRVDKLAPRVQLRQRMGRGR